MTRIRPLLLASLALIACQGAGPGDPAVPARGPEAPPMTAFLSIRDGTGAHGPFRVEELEKLAVEVQLVSAPAGELPLRLEVLGPGGELYAQFPVTAQPDASGRAKLTQEVEVRGTSIDLLRQTGAWTFRLAAADGAAPLATAAAELAE